MEQNGQEATCESFIAQNITQIFALLTPIPQKQRPVLTHNIRRRIVLINLIIRGQRERPHLLQHMVVITHHIGKGTTRNGGNPRAKRGLRMQRGRRSHLHGARRNPRYVSTGGG